MTLTPSEQSFPDVSPTPHTRSFRPCQVGALGVDGDIGIGGDGMGVDSEAVLGVWGDMPGGDGFYGPVPAGYGGADPDRGRGGAQDGIRPGVRAPLFPFWGHGPMDGDVCQYRRLRPLRVLPFGVPVHDEALRRLQRL